jgi:hypothetical protein
MLFLPSIFGMGKKIQAEDGLNIKEKWENIGILNLHSLMNKDRNRKLQAKKMYSQPVTLFAPVDLTTAKFVPHGMTRAFTNNRYVVMIYDNAKTSAGQAIQVLIQKLDNTKILNHWSEIQKIKNEIFGEEVTAVEYYPAKSKLIDDYNIYWIWIYPENILPMPII